MNKILNQVHKYKITQTKDGRWTTRILDHTKADGLRMVRRNSKQDLYDFLVSHYGVIEESSMTFSELFWQWIEYKKLFINTQNKSISKTTVTRYVKDMENHFLHLPFAKTPIKQINPILLTETFIYVITTNNAQSKTKQKAETMRENHFKNILGYFNGIFDYAVKKDLLEKNPMLKVDRQLLLTHCTPNKIQIDNERILSFEEIELLKKAVQSQIYKKPNYMPNYAILLALLTGLRLGELAALNWEYIDNDFIYISTSEHIIKFYDGKKEEILIGDTKNKKHRKIPITKDIKQLLDIIKSINPNSKFLFVNSNGLRHTGHDIACALDRRASEAGIGKTCIHGIRRTVSSILNTMLPRKSVANLLGHLEETNERFYDYDITDNDTKLIALQAMSQKVTDFNNYKTSKKIV